MTPHYQLKPYLFFNGQCEEAIEFYRKTIGGELIMLMRYKDAPADGSVDCPEKPDPDKVMHAQIKIGETTLMLADGPCSGRYDGFSLSLTVPTPKEAECLFVGLTAGGEIIMPLGKTFFSPAFGMLKDRFGVQWMIHVEAAV